MPSYSNKFLIRLPILIYYWILGSLAKSVPAALFEPEAKIDESLINMMILPPYLKVEDMWAIGALIFR